MAKGINLTLKIGSNNPQPASRELMEALDSVEVTHNDTGRSGFQIVFAVGRSGAKDQKDYKLLRNSLLKPFNRVILIVSFNAKPKILLDGIITNQQLAASNEPRGSTLTVTGEDVSVMMDLEEKSAEHPQQDEATISRMLISKYSKYGMVAKVVKPSLKERPTKNERVPVQQGTDLEYIKQLAERFAYVFYVEPGPVSTKNTAYWGPPRQGTKVQRALTVNMGSFTNVDSLNFQNNALAATTVAGKVQDRKNNRIQKVQDKSSDRPSLAQKSAVKSQTKVRVKQFRETGRSTAQAISRAQAMIDRSVDDVVTVTGELDSVRYGGLLEIRGKVGLRGAGYSYDGLYYVKSVTHKIRKGEYKQSFTITREGTGTTVRGVKV
ncbi:phage protein D [Rivularia sp. PCC 7116]|uniref:phage late control D family protein n=1 Tax=Rivularia sp. PCC 7116 TaxID=373994 RepID=UPI00029F2418|nr:phage protein D [Rivularia sp. PCC 7116]AFY57587.1 phage protein D [Rivularia sp. PCC 7116]